MRAISLRDAAIEVAQFSLALGTVGGVIGFIGGVVLKNDSMDGCTFTECGAIGGVLAPLGAAAYSWAHEQWVESLLTKLHGLTLERIWLGGAAICGTPVDAQPRAPAGGVKPQQPAGGVQSAGSASDPSALPQKRRFFTVILR